MQNLSLRSATIHFSGLYTEPVPSLHPASDSRCRVCLRISLLSRRLPFAQVGLSFLAITHWVTVSNFTSIWRLPTIRASLGAMKLLLGAFYQTRCMISLTPRSCSMLLTWREVYLHHRIYSSHFPVFCSKGQFGLSCT